MESFDIEVNVTFTYNKTVEAEDWEQAYDIAVQELFDGNDDEKIQEAFDEGFTDHDIYIKGFYE